MSTATVSPPPKGGILRRAVGGVADVKIADIHRESDYDRIEMLEELRRSSDEGQRYWSSRGYTEETFMEMVDELIHEGRDVPGKK